MLEAVIQNTVCTCNVGSTIYLPGLARALKIGEYNPKRFAAVTFRLRYPKTTALFFGSGKIVCTGAKNKNSARLALLYYVDLIRKRLGLNVSIYDFEIQNIVASADVGFPISLEKVCTHYNKESSYEPELFPGLIFRSQELPVVFLIFDSGRLVITGAKNKKDIKESFDKMLPILLLCKAQCFQSDPTQPPPVYKKRKLIQPELSLLDDADIAPLFDDMEWYINK